jgi:hypothetical protein
MIVFASVSAVLAAAFAAKAATLTESLRVARSELAASRLRLVPIPPPLPPLPPRQFECRHERSGLLWFPVLTVKQEEKVLVGVSSGLPHCARCVRPLKLVPGRREEWVCGGCDARHPAAASDFAATDAVLSGCLSEFFTRHPDFSPAPGLSTPEYAAAA